jgi:two-component system, NarL family, response regulator NreC
MAVRLLIADDQGIVRAAFSALLQTKPNYQVVGQAGSAAETLRLAAELAPDVVLLDWSMPGMHGAETIRELIKQVPDTYVLVLTGYKEGVLLEQALRAGAGGYIPKDAQPEDLDDAIQAVVRGDVYIHPSMVGMLAGRIARVQPQGVVVAEELSERERDVLRYVALGYTSQQIAETLLVSSRTVERHRGSLMDKLGLHSRAALVKYARENQIIN